jgi:hypothetical protein
LGERLTWSEFGSWVAYYKRDPWGEERADLRAALNTAALSNTVQMLAGAEHRDINLMPYSTRAEKDDDRMLTAEEEMQLWEKF